MSAEELDAIAAELPGDEVAADAAEQVEPDAAPEVSVTEQIDPAQLAGLVSGLVAELGNIICDRAKVYKLTDGEVSRLSMRAANVALQYDLTLTPKSAAWLGLGMVSLAVAGPRLKIVQARQGVPPKDEPVSAEPMAANQNVIQLQAQIDASNAEAV